MTRRPALGAAAPWVSTAARLVLAGVFVVAGVTKAVDPLGSVAAVRAYRLLPAALETPVGWGLPFLEIVLGLLLGVGVGTRLTAGVAGVLLVGFLGGVASAAARGLSIDCGCFGGGGAVAAGQTHYTGEILRDTGLLLLALWLVVRPASRGALALGPAKPPPVELGRSAPELRGVR
ncbi:MauE/DoxX family redox-associated membrane protein [uncultured Friedmanniella sp.]|uniref:MauE/DoxX family redox-associated membrane protein n=1 Tax=uncultured Friedmanniella sp. TaxID=335381 RepID=UPI0035CAB342